jgi:uncharacterized protein (TIGR02231 family)
MFIILLAALATINVQSKIDSVIIFSDRAVIIRKADITLTSSEKLKFPDLSGMIDDNTVRIKAEGLKIGEVQVQHGYIEKPSGRVKILQDSIDLLEDKSRTFDNDLKVLDAKETFLNSVKLGSPEIISKDLENGRVAPDAWRQALSFMADELTKVKTQQLAISHQKDDNQKILTALHKELSDIQAILENRKDIVVDVDANTTATFSIELSYVIPYAVSWSPYYELRADPSTGKVEIDYFAKISQRTAEDWNQVKVILSTAAPALAGIAPEPYPWYVSLEEMRPMSSGRMSMMDAGAQYAPTVPLESKAEIEVPRVETGISLQYVIPGHISLKSGEPSKKIALYQGKIPAEFEFFTLPKVQEIAYLKGKLKNSTDYVFLGGEANTYVGGEFTGKTSIMTIAPEESTEISFGTDERVIIKRELIKTFVSSSGFLSRKEKKEFVYQTTIENFHSREINIKLVEQIPVSQNKDVEVKVTKIEPTGYDENKDMGTFTWQPKLNPSQKFVVNMNYYVEYPKGKIVTGLY